MELLGNHHYRESLWLIVISGDLECVASFRDPLEGEVALWVADHAHRRELLKENERVPVFWEIEEPIAEQNLTPERTARTDGDIKAERLICVLREHLYGGPGEGSLRETASEHHLWL